VKTRELIRQLQNEDPEGDAEVVVGGTDIYFASREPMYYDGTPTLLVHDPEKVGKCFSVIGLRIPYGGHKVRLHVLEAEDLFIDHLDAPVVYDNPTEEGRARHRHRIEEIRAEMRCIRADIDKRSPAAPKADG
jgi:hypothetical protein